jgi:hypothetical protein
VPTPTFNFSTLNSNDMRWITNGVERMELNGPNGNIGIGTAANGATERLMVFNPTGAAPSLAPGVSILSLGTVSGGGTFRSGQVDGNRFWMQTYIPLTINELGQNVTIGTLAGGFGPATNSLLGNNNIITSNDDITMTVGTDPGDELTLINIDAPSENIDVLVIHDQASPNPNWVRRAEENTSQLTEQGITFNLEGGQSRIRLGSLTNGIDANVDAPFEADRFVNLVENELLFTGGAASTFNVLQLEGSSGIVNVLELASQNQGNTIMQLNGPATTGINVDMASTQLTNATSTGINVTLAGSGPIGVSNVTGATINATTPDDIAIGANITTSTTLGGSSRGLIVGSATTGGGYVEGATINATQNGTGTGRGASIDMTATNAAGGNIEGLVLTATTSSTTGYVRGLFTQAQKSAASAITVTGGSFNTIGNGVGTALGLASVVSGSTGGNTAGQFTATPGAGGSVLGLDVSATGSTTTSRGATIVSSGSGVVDGVVITATETGAGVVRGIAATVTKSAATAAASTGGEFTSTGNGTGVNRGLLVNASGSTASNIGADITVAGAGSVGIDINHPAAIGMTIDGGGNSIDADGSSLLGDNAGNDQLIVSTGTGPTTINTTANDVTINTDPASATGNDLIINGLDQSPTSPFDIMVIQDAGNEVRRANSDASNEITEQGITFNTEGGQTRIRLGDNGAGITVDNAPLEADRFVNLVQNSLNFTGGAASTSNVMRIQGNSGGALDQVSMTSLNATNLSVLKVNGPAITGVDIDPVQFGIRIDATNTLIQQTGSQPVNGLDMQVGVTGTGILINDDGGIPSTTGMNVGVANVALFGVRANATTGFLSVNTATPTFTSFRGDGAGYFGDNNGIDEFIVLADDGRIELNSANAAFGIDLTTTAAGGDGIDLVAQGAGEDVDIFANQDITLFAFTNNINATAAENITLQTNIQDIYLLSADEIFATAVNNVNITSTNTDITLTAGDDNILSATDNSITATTGSNTVLAQVGNSVTATTGNNTVTATAGDNILSATDNSVTATSGSNTILAAVNNSMTATAGDNSLTAGDDNLITATDDNALLATDNSMTATTGSNTLLAQVNNSVTATTGNNTVTATAGDNILSATDNSVTATSGSNTVVGQVNNSITANTGNNSITATLGDNLLSATDNSVTATSGNNTITATLGDNVLSATDNQMTATSGSNALVANVNNTLTATTGNNSLAAPAGDNVLTATDNSLTASTGNNTISATIGDNLLSATDNSITATSGSNTLLANVNNTLTATTGDNTLTAAAGENYLNAPINRVGSNVLPTSTLHVSGSVAAATSTGGTTALTTTQFFYLVNAASQTITLPAATGCQGRIYVIKNNASATNTTVTPAAGQIDGAASFVMAAANAAIQVISDGTNWWIISTN